MSTLETRLLELGAELEFPTTPDLSGAVQGRIAFRVPWWRRRVLLVAAATIVVAAAGVLAVPPARTAVLEWLGIRGVEIRPIAELPPGPIATELDLGEQISLAEVSNRVLFRPVPPPSGLGEEPLIYLRRPPAGGMVSYLYGTPERARLLISQFRADYRPFIGKFVGEDTTARTAEVGGSPALWLGGTHFIVYREDDGTLVEESTRRARNVLLWRHRGLTLRVEGALGETEAIRIAERLVAGGRG